MLWESAGNFRVCAVVLSVIYLILGFDRYKDAGYYYWMLAKEVEQELAVLDGHLASSTQPVINSTLSQVSRQNLHLYVERLEAVQFEYEHKADLYYAYANIHSFVTDPFTSFQPEMLFQVSRFIINSLGVADKVPLGISKTATLYTLAKQAMQLGAYKLARGAFDRLQKLFIPIKFADVELDMLLVQAKPIRDAPELLPVCYRCGSTNPLLNPFNNKYAKGDVCTNCGHPFVRSFINFDILPLVEFVPEKSLSDEEAIDLIRQNPAQRSRSRQLGSLETITAEGANVLSLNDSGPEGYETSFQAGTDLFTACLNSTLEKQVLAPIFSSCIAVQSLRVDLFADYRKIAILLWQWMQTLFWPCDAMMSSSVCPLRRISVQLSIRTCFRSYQSRSPSPVIAFFISKTLSLPIFPRRDVLIHA